MGPLLIPIDLKVIVQFTQLSPGWYFSDRTPEDWDEQLLPGIGDEISYALGGAIGVLGIAISANYEIRVTGNGTQQGVAAGIKIQN